MRPDVAVEWHNFFLMIPCMLVLGLLSHVKLFCDPMDYILPGFSVHVIFPGKNTGAGCHSSSRGFSDPGIEPASLALAGGLFTTEPPGKPNDPVLTWNIKVKSVSVIHDSDFKIFSENKLLKVSSDNSMVPSERF